MSEQENNRMEAWLKAYRQQRRDQWNEDPVELDEPTRAMLMAEVRRQQPALQSAQPTQPKEDSSASEPTLGWMRWALGGMTAAIVALGVTSLSKFTNDPSDSSDLAFMTRADNTSPEASGRMDEQKNTGVADASAAEKSNAGMAAKGFERGNPGTPETDRSTPPQTAPSVSSAPPVSSGSPGFAGNTPVRRQNIRMANGNFYNHAREMQLNFAQQNRSNRNGIGNGMAASRTMAKQKDLPKPVLVNFELKRVGNTIRVVDGDGSVYTGAVINEEAMSEVEEMQAMGLAASGEPGGGASGQSGGFGSGGSAGPSGANLAVRKTAVKARRGSQAFFRVQGTNKTLNQLVVLEATLDNTPAASAASDEAKKMIQQNPNVAAAALMKPEPRKPGETVNPSSIGAPNAPKPMNVMNGKMDAVRAIARMRVLGNARIGKEDFPIDAYLDTKTADKLPAQPVDSKKK